MTVVFNTLRDVAQNAVSGAAVEAHLVGGSYVVDGTHDQSTVVKSRSTTTNGSGYWQFDLEPTEYMPAGAVYEIREFVETTRARQKKWRTTNITVPASGGPYWIKDRDVQEVAAPPTEVPSTFLSSSSPLALAAVADDGSGVLGARWDHVHPTSGNQTWSGYGYWTAGRPWVDARAFASINAAIAAAPSGARINLGPGQYTGVQNVEPLSNTKIVGEGRGATTLVGVSGQNMFSLPTGRQNITLEGFTMYTALNLVKSLGAVGINIFDVDTEGCDQIAYRLTSYNEQWHWRGGSIQGGQYGISPEDTGATPYFDKSTIEDLVIGGQTFNNLRIEIRLANSILFKRVTFNTAGQHPVVLAGGLAGITFQNCNTEGGGQSGKDWRGTGTTSNGSNQLTSVSAGENGPPANGDTITVFAAGPGGVDLETTIVSGAGTGTITMANTASASKTATKVTNAIYDDFHVISFGGAHPSNIKWDNCLMGGESTVGLGTHLRYAIRHYVGGGFLQLTQSNTGVVPVYDPGKLVRAVGGNTIVRRLGWESAIGEEVWPQAAMPTVTGAKGGNAALTDLIAVLAQRGLINDNTS